MTALVWIWRHGQASVEPYESTEEAIRSAWYARESDECYMEGVEVDGAFIDHRGHPEWKRMEDDSWKRADESIKADRANPVTHYVELLHPTPSRDGRPRYATVEWAHGAGEASRLLREWQGRVDPDRVRLSPARQFASR